MNTDKPMSRKMTRPVSLCSLMPRKRGCSPGAELSDSSFRLLTWDIDKTVAATNQGKPMMEHTASITPTISRSRWYPQPFCKVEVRKSEKLRDLQKEFDLKKCCLTSSLCSLRLIMTAVICWSMKMRIVQRRAGIDAAKAVHHGFRPIGLMNQPRSSLVGWRGNYQKYIKQ